MSKTIIRIDKDAKRELHNGKDLLLSHVWIEPEGSCGEPVDVYGKIHSTMEGRKCVDAWVEITAVCTSGTNIVCVGLLGGQILSELENFILENAK